MRILIVEDEPTSAFLLTAMLQSAGFDTVMARTGLEAYETYLGQEFDAIVTDWMMPELNGIELVKKIRASGQPSPIIIMISALSDDNDREQAISAGVDGFVAKPITKSEILGLIETCRGQQNNLVPERTKICVPKNSNVAPAVAVGIAASTGGPPVLAKLVSRLPTNMGATFFITQHGPDWTLDSLAKRLRQVTKMPIHLAETGMSLHPNAIYLAPGSHHLTCTKNFKIQLSREPTEVGLIPAADPMFTSIAEAYGDKSIGVVLTGLGRDGSIGGQSICDVGGRMIAQNPKEAVAPFMPESILALGLVTSHTNTDSIPLILRNEIAVRNRRDSELCQENAP